MYKLFHSFFRGWYYIQEDGNSEKFQVNCNPPEMEKILFLKGIKVDKVLGTEIDKETYDLLRKLCIK